MKRIPLSHTKIKDLAAFDWLGYFQYNNSHLLKLDFGKNQELSFPEKELISPSIRAFQLGEGSDGKHLEASAKRFAEKTGYQKYPEIMNWFILEENRHSMTLKKYMEIYNIQPSSNLWIDNIFRTLRKLMGLECEVTILVTAEIIALSYYRALANATDSILLQTICRQMLNDELKHVVLQSDTLHRIYKNRKAAFNHFLRLFRKILMRMTVWSVWISYKDLFLQGHYTYRLFKSHCMEYLAESIYIEKTDSLCPRRIRKLEIHPKRRRNGGKND